MNLAYYKDIIFAAVVTLNFILMFNQNFIKIKDDTPSRTKISKCLVTLFFLTSVLMIGTLIFHFNSAFYRKGEHYEKAIK